MAEYVWGVRMEDDISATANASAKSLEDLSDDVQSLAQTFRVSQAATRALSVNLDQARGLFKTTGGNVSLFKAALKDAGVSALDSSILVGKMTRELQAERRTLLGVTAEEDAHKKAMREAAEERKRTIALIKQQAKEEKARAKAEEKAKKDAERRDKMGVLERMGITPHNIWVASHGLNVISKTIGAVSAVGGSVKSVVGGIAGKAMEVGQGLFESVVDAAQFRQNALTGLEYMLGSRKEAEDMFAYAQKYAQETPLDTDKVLGGMKALITQGFSGDEAKLLYKVVADQQSKYMDDSTMQDKVIAAFSRVQGRGKATGEDLESFRVAGFRAEGIVQELLKNEDLAPLWKKIKRQGMDGGKSSFVSQDKATQEEILKEVQAAMGEGRVGKYTLMNAAIASLEDGHDDIGEFAKKSGKNSLTGTISNVKALWGDLLKSVNIQDWPGIQSLQAFLARVVDLFSAGGPAATKLLGVVNNVFGAMTGGLNTIENKDILSWLDTLETFAKGVVSFIKEAWGWVDQLLHMESGSVADSAIDAIVMVGKYLGAALWEGFKAGGSLLEDRKNKKQVLTDSQYFSVASSTGLDEGALEVDLQDGALRDALAAEGAAEPEREVLRDGALTAGVREGAPAALGADEVSQRSSSGAKASRGPRSRAPRRWPVCRGRARAADRRAPRRPLRRPAHRPARRLRRRLLRREAHPRNHPVQLDDSPRAMPQRRRPRPARELPDRAKPRQNRHDPQRRARDHDPRIDEPHREPPRRKLRRGGQRSRGGLLRRARRRHLPQAPPRGLHQPQTRRQALRARPRGRPRRRRLRGARRPPHLERRPPRHGRSYRPTQAHRPRHARRPHGPRETAHPALAARQNRDRRLARAGVRPHGLDQSASQRHKLRLRHRLPVPFRRGKLDLENLPRRHDLRFEVGRRCRLVADRSQRRESLLARELRR